MCNLKFFWVLIGLWVCGISAVHAQKVTMSWAKSLEGRWFENGEAIGTDAFGNVIIAGYYSDTVDFNPGVGVFRMGTQDAKNNLNNTDGFILKLNKNGNFVWAKAIRGKKFCAVYGMTTDGSGNIYVTGAFEDIVNFGLGATNVYLKSNGQRDIFVMKVNALGRLQWVKAMGGSAMDVGLSIAVDPSGNVYTTGAFQGTVDFDPGVNTTNVTSQGKDDLFIQKLNASGKLVWIKTIGGNEFERGEGIGVGKSGDLYLTGRFDQFVDFDPGTPVKYLTSKGGSDVFALRIDSAGKYIWARSFGGTGDDYGLGIAIDPSENVCITGSFRSRVDFDPGNATVNISSNGSSDCYVQKLDKDGDFVWARTLGSWSTDLGNAIATDKDGHIYTTGYFRNTVDFDPGKGDHSITSRDLLDGFVWKLLPGGNLDWAAPIHGNKSQIPYDIALDLEGDVVTTGSFRDTADFDPGVDTFNLCSFGDNQDVFVLKLEQCRATTGIEKVTACNEYTWTDGNTYRSSNSTATDTFVNANGCDSVVTLNLTILSSSASIDSVVACDSFMWMDGNTYFNSTNSPTDTFVNAVGCDSIVTLHLTIHHSNSTIDSVAGCDNFSWIDGNTYYESTDTPTFVLKNANGCDSTVQLHLTIDTIDVGVTVDGAQLTATAVDATYQWIDCKDQALVVAATNKTYKATKSGDYAVVVSKDGCSDTSECISVQMASIAQLLLEKIKIFPNPSDGEMVVDIGQDLAFDLTMYAVDGRKVLEMKDETGMGHFDLSLEPGIYLLEVTIQGKAEFFRFVIN